MITWKETSYTERRGKNINGEASPYIWGPRFIASTVESQQNSQSEIHRQNYDKWMNRILLKKSTLINILYNWGQGYISIQSTIKLDHRDLWNKNVCFVILGLNSLTKTTTILGTSQPVVNGRNEICPIIFQVLKPKSVLLYGKFLKVTSNMCIKLDAPPKNWVM